MHKSEAADLDVRLLPESEFREARSAWNDLLDQSAADGPFLRWEWIHTWWDQFKKRRKLFIVSARRGGRLVGLAPLYIESATFPRARQLRFCSDELAPDYLDFIVDRDSPEMIARALVDFLVRHASDWDVLVSDSLRPDAALLSPSVLGGVAHAVSESYACPFTALEGTFEAYFKTRTELIKHFALERKIRSLFRNHPITHVVPQDEAALANAMDALFHLHKQRAENKGMNSRFADAETERFHRALAPLFLEQGFLRLFLLYDRDTPVGAHYDFCYKGKYYFFQGGFDPAYKKYSLGMILLHLMIQKAFEEGSREYDFLKGNESYKFLWSTGEHQEKALAAYSPLWRGRMWRSADGFVGLLRRLRRASVGTTSQSQ